MNESNPGNNKIIAKIIVGILVVISIAFGGLHNNGKDVEIPAVNTDNAPVTEQTQELANKQTEAVVNAPAEKQSETAVDESLEAQSEIAEDDSAEEQDEYTEYQFRNNKLLNDHFEKHGIEMGFETASQYEDAASDVINNDEALYKTEAEDGDGIYYLEETNEFVVLSTDGYIRTYYKPDRGKAYFDKQ